MLFNAALWYMKHAVKFAALDEYEFVVFANYLFLGPFLP